MRTYYIFLIKKEVYNITKDSPDNLFRLLESIYLLDKKDLNVGFKTFDKICRVIPKKNLNKLIKDELSENLCYTCFKNIHIINDFLNNESSKLTLYNSHIKIKSNSLYPTFFRTIKSIPNLFVCDFINMDYFYLRKVYTR